ncbi:hypothetical protein E0M25_15030 [Bacillus mycoides]|uniref:hypothetical protein n=2 Tax=Bacillus mycoides TaxID=1405 RepID=UPI001039DB0A|nr:hypothetical protein [Bacillus mycoides]TBX75883.1 hypothetical protein E0M25_15030 [Bacillus mycoides]
MQGWRGYVISNKSLFFNVSCIVTVIIGILFIGCNYTMKEIYRITLNWNLGIELSQYWYGLFIVYWTEIILLVVIWDLFCYQVKEVFNHLYSELSNNAVEKKKVRLLVKLVRVKYNFEKIHYYVRIGIVSRPSNQTKRMIDFIINDTIFDLLKKTRSIIFSFPIILASILTFFAYYKVNIMRIVIIKQLWNEKASLLWEHFTKLSAVVVLVLIVSLWYFISRKGVVRRSIAQANRKKLEDVIQLYRQSFNPISNVIIKGSKNIEYVIKSRDLILDYWMIKEYPHVFKRSYDEMININRYLMNFENFLVQEIPEIYEVTKCFEELLSPENKSISTYFSKYRYDLQVLFNQMNLKETDEIERIMFTKIGLKDIIASENAGFSKKVEYRKDCEEMQKSQELLEYRLDNCVIEGAEFLYEMYRYILILDKNLQVDSDKFGRALRTFLGKE